MAQPITAIPKPLFSEKEKGEKKGDSLRAILIEHEEALEQIMVIVKELHEAGVLETLTAMIQAKEKITEIGLKQINSEPVTNLLSLLMGTAGALTQFDTEQTPKLIRSLGTGLTEANQYSEADQRIKVFDLLKLLNDPDINRAIGFLIHFLKGMGKGLKAEENI
jgi:uncharacterized protein YjgD (DUF1641 family)